MPPLLVDLIHARACKPFCEKSLTLPGAWGLYQPVSTEKEQPISRLLLWVAICFCCVLLNKWEWFILTLFYMLTLNLQILLQ